MKLDQAFLVGHNVMDAMLSRGRKSSNLCLVCEPLLVDDRLEGDIYNDKEGAFVVEDINTTTGKSAT